MLKLTHSVILHFYIIYMIPQIKKATNISIDFFMDLIFPKFCLGCGAENSYLCQSCSQTLKINHFPFCPMCKNGLVDFIRCSKHKPCATFCLSPFSYDNNLIKNLLHKYKYEFIKDIGYDLANFMIESINKSKLFSYSAIKLTGFLIVPVPLHKKRLVWRGFNQSEILARKISEKLNIEFAEALKRIKNTKPQIEMADEKQRQENIKDAFICENPLEIKNKIIILVDDMITTGATLEECAHVLKQNGAREVWALTVAK